MQIRRRVLPSGWYPDTAEETSKILDSWDKSWNLEKTKGVAAIVPHAGWSFSGQIAFNAMKSLSNIFDTIVIIGGHLAVNDGIMAADEDAFETPFGDLPADKEVLSFLRKNAIIESDLYADNTIEVNLPIIHYLFPKVKIVCIRVEPSIIAEKLGILIYTAAEKLEKKIGVIGSTDLTHYGPSYNFTSHGKGKDGYSWVKNKNDKMIIEAFSQMDIEKALHLANINKAACSCGGAAASIAYAEKNKRKKGVLTEYGNSYKVYPSDSFVGYAGIVY